uniref:V-SNARE coiled-coil homology domain-containing protein n=1 Tax=Zosterops lateralis melanops TaxID=1220523 RepID=A0A8D2NP50_ZOSLA
TALNPCGLLQGNSVCSDAGEPSPGFPGSLSVVVDIMCVNVDKVLQRDEKLSELDDRADALQAGASVFESSAAKLKNKYWWKNCKMMIIMGVIGALVVVVIARKYQKPQAQR